VRWKVVGYCNVDSADVVINNFRKPISLAGSERFICEDTLTLLANNPLSIASTASGEWLRIDGDATAQISNPSSYNSAITSLLRGDYTLQWTVSNGVCAPAVSNTIIHVNEPFSFGVITTKRGDHEKETGSITVSKPFYAFSPIRLSIDDQAFFSDTLFDSLSVGKHELHLIDFAGCRVDTIIEIRPNLFIPNGISPNGDQANDTWQLLGIDAYSGAVVRLFNLWGQKIFESVSNQDIFDGTFQGEQLPDGDYYYIIDLNDGSEVLKGKLTMIR
jgi:gliding motility-associated-like protein